MQVHETKFSEKATFREEGFLKKWVIISTNFVYLYCSAQLYMNQFLIFADPI